MALPEISSLHRNGVWLGVAAIWIAAFTVLELSGLAISFPSSASSARPAPPPAVTATPPTPAKPSTPAPSQPVPNQKQSAGNQPQIVQAFHAQVRNGRSYTLRGTIIVSTWALQSWNTEHTGGEALFSYSPSQGWKLVDMGGGAWSAPGLATKGMPRPVADQIIAGRNWK